MKDRVRKVILGIKPQEADTEEPMMLELATLERQSLKILKRRGRTI